MLDLDYSEDAGADVDFNVVMTDAHAFVEIQGHGRRSALLPATLTRSSSSPAPASTNSSPPSEALPRGVKLFGFRQRA